MLIETQATRKVSTKYDRPGFTMLELAVVLVIIGIILSAIGLGWQAVVDARRVAKTQSTLLVVKDCILERMYFGNTYPSYTNSLDCAGGVSSIPNMDIDTCLCDKLDAWGQPIYFIGGRQDDAGFTPLFDPTNPTDLNFIVNNPAHGQVSVDPDATNSAIIDKDGTTIQFVAFALVSFGRNGVADDPSYGNLFAGGVQANTLDLPTGANGTPDFTFGGITGNDLDTAEDDIVIYVTGPELKSLLTQ